MLLGMHPTHACSLSSPPPTVYSLSPTHSFPLSPFLFLLATSAPVFLADRSAVRKVNRKLLAANLPGQDEAYARTGLFGFVHSGQVFVIGNRRDDILQLGLRYAVWNGVK